MREALVSRLPLAILALNLVIAAGLLLNLTSRIGFRGDEWNLLILRPGWGLNQIFEHFNGHPIMAPALIYKTLQEVFGMESARPMQIVAIATFLLMNVLLFVYLRRRVGDWVALIGTLLILFLGAALENLLWAFQIGFFGSLAAGIGALIALDRSDREGDVTASVLLVVSITFSSIGLAFIAAALVEWVLNPNERRERWFVPGASIIFYAIWWIGWGGEESLTSMNPEFNLSVLPKVPSYVFDAFSAGLTSLAGLADGRAGPDRTNLIWGQLTAVALIGIGIWRLRVLGRPPKDFLVAGGALLALLFSFALGQDAFQGFGPITERPPTSSRYQLPIAVLILATTACLLRGVRIGRFTLVAAALVSLLAISSGVHLMSSAARDWWYPPSDHSRATLTGVEAIRPAVSLGYAVELGTLFELPASAYLRAVDAHGSPAFSLSEIRGQDGSLRLSADSSLIEASGVSLSGTPPPYIASSCRKLAVGRNLDLKPGRYVIVNTSDAELSVNLARISDPPGILLGAILPNARAGLDLPKGTLDDPWTISFAGEGPARVCGAR